MLRVLRVSLVCPASPKSVHWSCREVRFARVSCPWLRFGERFTDVFVRHTVSPHRLSSRRRRTLEAGRWTSDTTATTCRSTPSLEPSWMPVSSHIVSFHRARPPGHLGRDCPRRRSRSLQMWLRWFCPRRSASRRRRLRLCCRHEMLCLPSAEASRRRQPVQQQLLRTQISGRTCGR